MTEQNKVIYKCQECKQGFKVAQGSRQRYCPACLVKRVAEGMNRQGKHRREKK